MWISVNPVNSCCSTRVRDELLGGDRVGLLLLLRRGEGAELAFHAADVRLVQVHVLDEEDVVRAPAQAPCEVGELADREQLVGFEQAESVLEIEPLTRLDLLSDRRQRGCCLERRHRHLSTRTQHDRIGEGLQLLTTAGAVERLPRPSSVVERRRPVSVRARRWQRRGRARRRAIHPRGPLGPTGSTWAAAGAARWACRREGRCRAPCPSRSCRRCSRGCRRRSGTRSPAAGRTRRSARRPARRQAASNSFPVLSAQRWRYAVHRRLRVVALSPLESLAPGEARHASARMATAARRLVSASSGTPREEVVAGRSRRVGAVRPSRLRRASLALARRRSRSS